MGNDPNGGNVRPPSFATCGDCVKCIRCDTRHGTSPWEWLGGDIVDSLDKLAGICVDDEGDPVAVRLDASVFSLSCPCWGDSWEPR